MAGRAYVIIEPVDGGLRFTQAALPEFYHEPSGLEQCLPVSPVSSDVFQKLCIPEFGSGGRRRCVPATFVTMPEATMNKDADTIFRQYDIGFSRQLSGVQSKPKPLRMQGFPHFDLRLGVFCPYRRHVAGASSGGLQVIGHSGRPRFSQKRGRSGVLLSSTINCSISFAVCRMTSTTTELPNCL